MTGSDELTSRELRDNIRRTRARMDATVEAIEERLTPGELLHEAWGLFRGGSSSSMGRIWRIANQHPLPSALISAGLGWMVYESFRGDGRQAIDRRGPARYVPDADEPGMLDAARERARHAARRAADVAGTAAEQAGEVTGQARAMASDVADQAREMASDVAESVRRQASELGRQASEVGAQTRHGVQRAQAGLWDTLERDPLLVGAATVAAGFLVGLLLPSTRREDELMGETRDALIDQVKGIGLEALEKGKQVASAAAETLREGAEAQGLSAETVAEKVRAVGRDVVDTVKTEAQKQKLAPEPRPEERREGADPTPHSFDDRAA